MSAEREYHHPRIIRITHWLNFAALGVMVMSGLRIYNASPIWDFKIPEAFIIGGWLAGARQWHFFAMWILVVNGLVWVVHNVATRHGRQTTLFSPTKDLPGIVPMMKYYLGLRKERPPAGKYNALQKLAYTTVPLAALGTILTGMAIYWPVQCAALARFFGGYDTARIWHFLFMGSLVVFFLGHIIMVLLAGWYNFVSMITGWKRTR